MEHHYLMMIFAAIFHATNSSLSWMTSDMQPGNLGDRMCGGLWGDIIWLLGEVGSYAYHINSSSFTLLDNIQTGFGSWSQQYTTIGSGIYMYDESVYSIATFNMSSTDPFYSEIAGGFREYEYERTCITHSNDLLFLVGGCYDCDYDALAIFLIYDILNNAWNTNGPSMTTPRERLTCESHNGYLYAIAGYNGSHYLASVETINITDIHNQQWQILHNELSVPRRGLRSALHGNLIYVIGGYNEDYRAEVDVINTENNAIWLDSVLPVSAAATTAIIGSNLILYVFGGETSGSEHTMQFAILGTPSPTATPTSEPTSAPVFNPTGAPTQTPTEPPTNAPTRYPTILNQYDQQILIKYEIKNLYLTNLNNMSDIYDINDEIVPLIEMGYVNVPLILHLQYKDFHIVVNTFIYQAQNEELKQLTMMCDVYYHYDSVGQNLHLVSRTELFRNLTQNVLRYYYQNDIVIFNAEIIDNLNMKKQHDYVFDATLIFIAVMMCGSFSAFVYNKKNESKTDDANWLILVLFGITVGDFVSDILLSSEIFAQTVDQTQDLFLTVIGICSVVFITLPYFINIYTTWKFELFIIDNKCAIMHFKKYRMLFIFLMFITGSTYISALVLSSRIFAMEIFCSGLTKYEIGKLAKLKIMGAV
eukprot:197125_1